MDLDCRITNPLHPCQHRNLVMNKVDLGRRGRDLRLRRNFGGVQLCDLQPVTGYSKTPPKHLLQSNCDRDAASNANRLNIGSPATNVADSTYPSGKTANFKCTSPQRRACRASADTSQGAVLVRQVRPVKADCSGFVLWVFKGFRAHRDASPQSDTGTGFMRTV